jgi:hypothetical protein
MLSLNKKHTLIKNIYSDEILWKETLRAFTTYNIHHSILLINHDSDSTSAIPNFESEEVEEYMDSLAMWSDQRSFPTLFNHLSKLITSIELQENGKIVSIVNSEIPLLTYSSMSRSIYNTLNYLAQLGYMEKTIEDTERQFISSKWTSDTSLISTISKFVITKKGIDAGLRLIESHSSNLRHHDQLTINKTMLVNSNRSLYLSITSILLAIIVITMHFNTSQKLFDENGLHGLRVKHLQHQLDEIKKQEIAKENSVPTNEIKHIEVAKEISEPNHNIKHLEESIENATSPYKP